MAIRVASSFDFCSELHRIALAQALRGIDPARTAMWADRAQAYGAAGLSSNVALADDLDALRRHHARPVTALRPIGNAERPSVNPIDLTVTLGAAA